MTEMNETNGVILKTDRRGRLRYSPEQKQAFIEAFEASGLSAPRFAAHHGVRGQHPNFAEEPLLYGTPE